MEKAKSQSIQLNTGKYQLINQLRDYFIRILLGKRQ